MTTTIHFIDVGQGNMVLVQCADGSRFVVDCNITESNRHRIIRYLTATIGRGRSLRAFVCTHRDADHMRGITTLHDNFPIRRVWDSGYPGTSTDTPEYEAYMRLRRSVGARVIKKKTYRDFGRTRFRYLSGADDRLPRNANEQGIVLKVEQRTSTSSIVQGSTILTGDGGATTWKRGILRDYAASEISCDILLAAHHGSLTFFEDPDDPDCYYTRHIRAIEPDMAVVSVGRNSYGHPDKQALALYSKYARGSSSGNKIVRTDQQGTMKLTLKPSGGWNLKFNQ